jgi:hypothetical protein
MLAFFHDNYGRIPREIHFYLGLCLVVSSAFMFGNFEETARSMAHWKVSFRQEFPHFSVFLIQFIFSTKNIIALGFSAFGASVAANAINNTGK